MNKFVSAARRQKIEARTQNNMKALASTTDACVDLFFHIGASRGKDVTSLFTAAYAESPERALRIALWARDVRGGSGERQLFRDILLHLEKHESHILLQTNFLARVPELGRWDDLLVLETPAVRKVVNGLIADALLKQKNGLCAKWMPRKGARAALLRSELGWTPKFYRKTLVNLTNVVETQMCSKNWTAINFEHVPSLAMARYTKAFGRNAADAFTAYKQALQAGEAKINASAVYPYDVLKTLVNGDEALADEMWKALPNYMDEQNVLPIVDVSGSMTWVQVSPGLTPLDVAVSLGLYCADKNQGAFKDVFMSFSDRPNIHVAKGKLSAKVQTVHSMDVGGSTNLHAALDLVLSHGIKNQVAQKDMPTALLIMSDMQFNECARYDDSAYQMITRKYEAAGYKVPGIVFWNLHSYANVPVDFKTKGVALVSGFSPAIMKSILAMDFKKMTPEHVMLTTIMNDRYSFSEEV